jgi:hypothetical protein
MMRDRYMKCVYLAHVSMHKCMCYVAMYVEVYTLNRKHLLL